MNVLPRKQEVLTQCGDKVRVVLDTLLAKYTDEGVMDQDDKKVLQISPLDKLGTPSAADQGIRGLGRF
uniref:Uncharacterized protein n=1 Tax=Candidatus Kentrum sp. LPFa TaxID=2126335 RepID=A0A450Y0I0_9GAMM|nr:MAG: hypothetical protein BECKLPF1236A_GA0070988_102873 [Candidatus Kentron sp. LPFa]VFK35022.1 MAG: hypothetical protein BECKLPF1236C_GA0070990_103233 [Candidatus Kentron sp. LPFa]